MMFKKLENLIIDELVGYDHFGNLCIFGGNVKEFENAKGNKLYINEQSI